MAVGVIGVSGAAVISMSSAPFVALATGIGQILIEVRENAACLRPFVGARRGFPFLDPSFAPAEADPTIDDTEE